MVRSTREAVEDLRRNGRLIVVDESLSPHLEIAEVQRRVYANRGPAVLFTNPSGCRFPMVSNLFGSLDQARFLFRHTIERVRRAIELKIDPTAFFRRPTRYLSMPSIGWSMLPRSTRRGAVLQNEIAIRDLPQLVSWPDDGGSFITLPQVLSQSPNAKQKRGPQALMQCNLGMYRIQLSGNAYQPDREIGLHYQIHRGIGIHHQQAIAANEPLRVSITVGGNPAMTLAAVMPLPEGLSELTFAGALAGHRIPMIQGSTHAPIYADADFAITGTIDLHSTKPEGPFGDHLGYYARQHEFPWMRVEHVYHRKGAIWPFTVVGRPPQEDTTFGELIHELTGPIVPTVLPGVRAVHAVDAAGVHPLLLAIGSERYTPYRKPGRPQELLTQSNAILGQGQMSLAKYLVIADGNEAPNLDIHDVEAFFVHALERVDWNRDLHFQTKTTIDTLDYSGSGLNQGSKVVMAASGPKRFSLARELPSDIPLPPGFTSPKLCIPGVVAVQATEGARKSELLEAWEHWIPITPASTSHEAGSLNANGDAKEINCRGIRMLVIVDDSAFTSQSLRNWLWVTFTRSDPAADIDGIHSQTIHKHWGCNGPLVIDARKKIHHAPPLIEAPEVTKKIDSLATRGGPIAKYL